MNRILIALGSGILWLGVAVEPPISAVYAANADSPYSNIDRRNDAGNDTGDKRVDGLNANQLNGNYTGAVQPRAPSTTQAPASASPQVK